MVANILILFLFLCTQLTLITTVDVLILQPFGPMSHRRFVVPIVKQLAQRGHHVTFVSMFSFDEPIENVTEISFPQFQSNFKILQNIAADTVIHGWGIDTFRRYYYYHAEVCERFYKSGLIQNWMSKGKKFPIVMLDCALQECIIPLWKHVGENLILLNTGQLIPWVREAMNLHTPYSIVPFISIAFNSHMNFFQRCVNTLLWVMHNYVINLSKRTFYEHVILPHFPTTKPNSETYAHISLVLVNHDPVMILPSPTLPTIIPIGGINCKPAKPLTHGQLKDFVDGSDENGFILLSFGSVVNRNVMDDEKLRIFKTAFAQIKQRVVWKFETQVPDLPSNVMITDWVPQQDLLGHPKIRSFINHGGLQSLQEAIYHGVSQICFPMTTDQPLLVAITSAKGIVIELNINTVTAEEIVEAIHRAITDQEIKKSVKYYSKIFRDRDTEPLDKAIYWIEYVMRYRGAHHLQTAAANLNFYQYYLFDVGAFGVVILISIIFLLWFSIKRLFKIVYLFLFEQLKNVSFKIKTT